VHEYRADFTPLERIRYINAILDAAERGDTLECASIEKWIVYGTWTLVPLFGYTNPQYPQWAIAADFHSSGLAFRVARPKIAEGYNPGKLTEAQVGTKDGWRLLAQEEREEGERIYKSCWGKTDFSNVPRAECMKIGENEWRTGGGCIRADNFVYRTKNPAGYYLPKPKTLVPWTLDTVPKCYLLVREKDDHALFYVVTCYSQTGLTLNGNCYRPWPTLAETCEHSTDGLNWLPCGTES
jgi:hypothetical protein